MNICVDLKGKPIAISCSFPIPTARVHHRTKHFFAQAPCTATILKMQDYTPAPKTCKTHRTFTSFKNPRTCRNHQKPAHGHYFYTTKMAMSILYETCAQSRNITPPKPVHGHKSSKKGSGRERLVRDLSKKSHSRPSWRAKNYNI